MKVSNKTADIDNDKSWGGVRLCFRTPEMTQKSIERLIRARQRNKIKDSEYKAILYGTCQLLSWVKHNKELDIEKRLEKLEEIYNAKES